MPACYTQSILPHPLLRPYIRCFAIRKFDTAGCEFPKAMIADYEMVMVFFHHSKLFDFAAFNKKKLPYRVKRNEIGECCFAGLQTSTNAFIVFKGITTIINIHFTPAGFFYIFNLSPKEFVDKMGDCEDILSREIVLLQEAMQEILNIEDCIPLLEKYLLKKITNQKPKYRHAGIILASDFLLKQKGIYSIRQLASDCNMTLQTFEIQFTEQVGIDPKYFSRILRFNLAVNAKLYDPRISWTDVAYTSGYYDQAHLINDFKEFSSLPPKAFMKLIHPPIETFV